MEKKKALLVVTGGRALPDVLTVFDVQPALIIYLTSEEGWGAEEAFKSIVEKLPFCKHVHAVRDVNAYDLEAGIKACEQACEQVSKDYPDIDWEWIFAISSGPKITGIAAYEVARQKEVPCLYINTLHEKKVSLVKPFSGEEENLFHLDIENYMKIQRRTYYKSNGPTADYRKTVEDWGDIAKELAFSPDTNDFLFLFRKKGRKEEDPVLVSSELAASELIQSLEKKHHLIELKPDGSGAFICTFRTREAAHFLGTGDWLEIFVWNEVRLAGFADDYQWGCQVIDGNAENELDMALLYKAQLVIGECKTDYEPFKDKRKYLESLDSTANILGGLYVTKLFITNQPMTKKGYDSFKEQADKRHIVVVTAEDLPHIRERLEAEAKTPKFPRI